MECDKVLCGSLPQQKAMPLVDMACECGVQTMKMTAVSLRHIRFSEKSH